MSLMFGLYSSERVVEIHRFISVDGLSKIGALRILGSRTRRNVYLFLEVIASISDVNDFVKTKHTLAALRHSVETALQVLKEQKFAKPATPTGSDRARPVSAQ
jgi:hypothetical protein